MHGFVRIVYIIFIEFFKEIIKHICTKYFLIILLLCVTYEKYTLRERENV